MKTFDIWLTVTMPVKLHLHVAAKDRDDARRIFVNRVGNWESTQPRLLPDVSMQDSILPNRDYNGEDIEIEERIDNEDEF